MYIQELPLTKSPAFVGLLLQNSVIYNTVLNDSEFIYTGLSIINQLQQRKIDFMHDIIKSQAYNSIDYIFDDKIILTEYNDIRNENKDTLEYIINVLYKESYYDYFYIYDVERDLLLVKTPELNEMTALEYNNSRDVREFAKL